jgi:hypothetical protein
LSIHKEQNSFIDFILFSYYPSPSLSVKDSEMQKKLLFSWDIVLLLIGASFVYCCFDKIVSLIAILVVSNNQHVDVVPLLQSLATMNSDFAKTMISLVGTFFTLVIGGQLFKTQQEPGADKPTDKPVIAKPTVEEETPEVAEAEPTETEEKPLITKAKD